MSIQWVVLLVVAILIAYKMFRWMFPAILTEKEVEIRMEAFFKQRLPRGLPITREEIVEGVFGGRNVPMLVKDDGRVVWLKTAEWHNGWSARVFEDGRALFLGSTPEEFREKYAAFKRRVPIETPLIRAKLLEETFNGVGVAEVGDLCWWPNTDHSYVLAAATLNDGKHVVVGYEDGIFSLISSERRDYQMVLDNLQRLPALELDDDHIDIHFAKDRQLLVMYQPCDCQDRKHGWNVDGFGWSGSLACKKFAEHGMSCSVEE